MTSRPVDFDQSEGGAGRVACTGYTPSSREERPGGAELGAAAKGWPKLAGRRVFHRDHQGFGTTQTAHSFNTTAFYSVRYRLSHVVSRSQDGGVDGLSETCGSEHAKRPDLSMTTSRHDTEEATVSQLLQSLRNETQRAELLQAELKSSKDR